jgi:AraC-like DNA-binding protein
MKMSAGSFHRCFPVSRRDKNWGLYATTAGETRIAPHTSYPPGGHPGYIAFDWQHGRIFDEFALVYISSGCGKFESKPGVSLPIQSGNAFLLFPGVWHRYAPNSKTGWHEHWIGFDGEIARRWLQRRFFSAKNPVVKISAGDTVLATFSRVMQMVRANCPALQQILGSAASHLMALFYSAQQGQSLANAQSANAVELAIGRLQNEFDQDLNMSLLARELGVSYRWFRGAFAAQTGLGPHQYLLELRLVRARSLLVETELSVREIAMKVGFEDEFYFSRLFHQKLNLTPSQWRNRSVQRRQFKR